MKKEVKWLSFVSQTGGEALNIYNTLKRLDIDIQLTIATNHPENLKADISEHRDIIVVILPTSPNSSDYEEVINRNNFDIITLNGWLRIIPQDIANKYVIYNGHPGNIIDYPELKGKDPQVRAFLRRLNPIGSIIHKVDPEVDSGEVLLHTYKVVNYGELSYNDFCDTLKTMSLDLWINFFLDNLK